jgi:hypothetical protein
MIEQLDTAWLDFQESYAGLSDESLQIPEVVESWSIRDLIEHVTWWEEEAIKHLPEVLAGKRPAKYSTTYGGIDAFNAWMTERKRSLTLDQARVELSETHARLVAYIRGVPPEEIVAQPKFRHRLRLDTFGHYPIHAKQIREWREGCGL